MLWTHWSCARCTLQLSHHVHDHFSVEHEVPPCTEHPHMTSNPVAGILSKRPLMSFTVMVVKFLSFVLSAQLVIFISTLILNLAWFSSCPCSGPRPVPAVGNALVFSFARAHPCGWVFLFFCTCSFTRCGSALFYLDLLTPRRYWLVLLWTPRLTCPSGPVSPLASAELTLPVQCEALVTSRTWLFTC